METFMMVNKAARRRLVEAMNIARRMGYRILYGNSDGLFLHRGAPLGRIMRRWWRRFIGGSGSPWSWRTISDSWCFSPGAWTLGLGPSTATMGYVMMVGWCAGV